MSGGLSSGQSSAAPKGIWGISFQRTRQRAGTGHDSQFPVFEPASPEPAVPTGLGVHVNPGKPCGPGWLESRGCYGLVGLPVGMAFCALTHEPRVEITGAGVALLILLTVAAYLPAMRGGFVFDDHPLITENRLVKANDGLYRFWCTTDAPDYYPLTWSLWWVEWRFWGNRATGYHVVNVLLHAINAVLVWRILRRLEIPGAWLAGLVFALHPVNVATAAWISEQKNTLSMFFYAAAILLYLRFDEECRWRWYVLSLASFLLALLGKSAVVMLPVVLLGCAWWKRGRVQRRDFLRSVPFFVLSLASGLLTVWFQQYRALEGHAVGMGGFASRLAMAGQVPWFYLEKTLLPFNLTVVYPKWEIPASRWISYVPGMVLVGCLAWFWWKRKTWGRPLLFGLGYFVGTLFPVLGFFDQGFYSHSLVADPWQYYAIIGVIALAVAGGMQICRRMKQRRFWGAVASLGGGDGAGGGHLETKLCLCRR